MIIVKQRKILETPVEPKNKNWLWLAIEDDKPVLRTCVSGKWVPFAGGVVEENTNSLISYDEMTNTLMIE